MDSVTLPFISNCDLGSNCKRLNSANHEFFIEEFEANISKCFEITIYVLITFWLNYHYLCQYWHLNFFLSPEKFHYIRYITQPDYREEVRRINTRKCIRFFIRSHFIMSLLTLLSLLFDPTSTILLLAHCDIMVSKTFIIFTWNLQKFLLFQFFIILFELFVDMMGYTWTTFGMLLITFWLRYETLKWMCYWIGGVDDIHQVIKQNFYEFVHILTKLKIRYNSFK